MKKLLLRLFLSLLVLGGAFAGFIVGDAWQAFGKKPEGERLSRMQASERWDDGVFTNVEPMWNDVMGSLTGVTRASEHGSPEGALPVVRGDGSRFETAPETGLRITWLGHSTLLFEIDGQTLLTDPIFGGRASPVTWLGPAVWYAPPIPLDELPDIDAVLISHDHYDHLQHETIVAMADWDTRFIVPLGVGAHLAYWGVPEDRITEVDWWEEVAVGGVTVVSTPARHASGRQVFDQMRTLWTGFAVLGPEHRIWYSGDTGLTHAFKDVGERLGPFDVTMIEVGAYDRAWPDWHIGPEQAVLAHQQAKGEVFLPVHWGLWNLALHGWTEPAERVLVAAEQAGVKTTIPKPGQSIEPAALPPLERWWPDVPWETAAENPIVSRGLE